ncbi:hypothetical protein [Bordetella petrii]|uniref:hypothetical protein n=1 Tax=Bordetella petrii TaxID=94624 RepID=UPI001A970179|nr:hypothetical protein [Bordetella petrii]MBO1112581.1 hypothetical protein [Bordetella petrii]
MMQSCSEGWPATRKLAWALGLSLALLLSACGSDSDDDDAGAPPSGGTECTADAHCAPAP